jgi:hypothetical protein
MAREVRTVSSPCAARRRKKSVPVDAVRVLDLGLEVLDVLLLVRELAEHRARLVLQELDLKSFRAAASQR